MTEDRETRPQAAPEPAAGQEHGPERERPFQPRFGQEEAEAVAAVQDQAVEQDLLPPGRDEAGPASS